MSQALPGRNARWRTISAQLHDNCIICLCRAIPTGSGQQPPQRSRYSSHVRSNADRYANYSSPNGAAPVPRTPLGRIAKQKLENKEFFADLISAAATKRDSKAYISRLKSVPKPKHVAARSETFRHNVNLGSLFGGSRAVDQSPQFAQHKLEEPRLEEVEDLHLALVKINDIDQLPDNILYGIGTTLSQLAKLQLFPCIVLGLSPDSTEDPRKELVLQGARIVAAIENNPGSSSRTYESFFTIGEDGTRHMVPMRLLLRPLRQQRIPIVLPVAYSEAEQKIVPFPPDEALVLIAQNLARNATETVSHKLSAWHDAAKDAAVLDRVILIDVAGGIPSPTAVDRNHIFINLDQEFSVLESQLKEHTDRHGQRHLNNLTLLRKALKLLPPTSSGLITSPMEAANIDPRDQQATQPAVGTRRSKSVLIHNLLTDKPAYSSSLPNGRLSSKSLQKPGPAAASTFVKHGMPLKILPDPWMQKWTPESPRIKLTDSSIDLKKLVYLINDSFGRKLDIDHYLNRINERIAGVIIAGDYEGGAILTWETPLGVAPTKTDRLVPYLDKFAVLKQSQGAGGVADIVFNAMVRSCFPQGVCWRSRKDNPVNKWYFERSTGTWKIPGMNWTMFWTTPGVASGGTTFLDYESVCRNVKPSWSEKARAAD